MSVDVKTVGGEVPSLCMRCKKATEHIIISMLPDRIAKVQCKTCGGHHRYRNPATPLRSSRKPVKASPQEVWEKVMGFVASEKKIPYTFSGHFKVNDLIDHTTFGLGVVTHLLPEDKIQVIFKDGEKILISGR